VLSQNFVACVQTVVGHPVRMNVRHSSLWNLPTDSKTDRVSSHIRMLKVETELVSKNAGVRTTQCGCHPRNILLNCTPTYCRCPYASLFLAHPFYSFLIFCMHLPDLTLMNLNILASFWKCSILKSAQPFHMKHSVVVVPCVRETSFLTHKK